MTKITVTQDGYRRSLVMEGHADYSPGDDIVCAGCSAIAYALLGWCKNFPSSVWDVEDMHDAEGDVVIKCSGDVRFMTAFDMAIIGLAQIAAKFPDNVIIIDK
jgi:uncharacterized protein YsxB (DUF464 family)